MRKAVEGVASAEAADIYENFLRAREAAMIAQIRQVCGVTGES